jgi:hypothetical protein
MFLSKDEWEIIPEKKTVSYANMYHRGLRGKPGNTVLVSVGAMDTTETEKWIQIVEPIATIDGGHLSRGELPKYFPAISN